MLKIRYIEMEIMSIPLSVVIAGLDPAIHAMQHALK